MKNNREFQEELKDLAPCLAKRKAENDDFKVPANYFHNLQNEVLEKVQREKTKQSAPGSPSLRNKWGTWLEQLLQPGYRLAYVVGGMALLAVAIIAFSNIRNPTQTDITAGIDNISDEALLEYVQANLDDFDSSMIIETHQANRQTLSLPELVPAPDGEEIENYLDGILDELSASELESLL